MKPRGINGLLSKQTSNLNPAKGPLNSKEPSINWNAPAAPGTPGSEKQDQGKTGRDKGNKGPSAKQSSGGSKNAAAVPRRTAPGA